VDTWGVDFGLLGRGDVLLGNPVHYRDSRTDNVPEQAYETVSCQDLFRMTGAQSAQHCTIFQVLAMKWADSPILEQAESCLMMPDLFHWLLSGRKSNEYTIATTSEMLDPLSKDWSSTIFEKFDLPRKIFGEIVMPGTNLGPLRPELGVAADVVVPGSHDTANAVMAVPTESPFMTVPDWCYISVGTWALLGLELPDPNTSDEAFSLGFTNEGGVGGTTRLIRNNCGLWLVQECKRVWNSQGKDWDWEALNRMLADAEPFVSLIDPASPDFWTPESMPEAIRGYCRKTGQPVPESEGAILRAAIESLALMFCLQLAECEAMTGQPIRTIHMVGGGIQNRQLCQATADACGRTVVAGPTEATAIGSIMTQALAAGLVGSVPEARAVVRASFPPEVYTPSGDPRWAEALERFRSL
jgi:rhamnulokinase